MKKIIFIIIYCGMIIICKDSKYNSIEEESNKFKPNNLECILVDDTEKFCKKVIPMISKKRSKKSK